MKCQVSPLPDEAMLEMEEELFMDVTFDVSPEERPQPMYATAPMYVTSMGRGQRRNVNPLDIPLPKQYYDQLEQKIRDAKEKSAKSTKPVVVASLPRQKEVRSDAKSNNARPRSSPRPRPSPQKKKEKVESQIHIDRLGPVPESRSKPTRGRGRGRSIQEGLQHLISQKSVMQVRELGNTGLPNGSADLEEGKARLMQMFLGQQSQFEIDTELAMQPYSSDSSIRSSRTAPNFNLKNDEEFPQIISKGVPFKSSGGGSLDDDIRKRVKARLGGGRLCNSSGGDTDRDGVSSSVDTAERRGHSSPCRERGNMRTGGSNDADVDTSNCPSGSQHRTQSSDENSCQPLDGANVLELSGLPCNMSKGDLGDLLMGCGNVIDMKLLRESDTDAFIGLAYVRMEDAEACEMAVLSYDGTESPFSEMYNGEIPTLSVRLLPT